MKLKFKFFIFLTIFFLFIFSCKQSNDNSSHDDSNNSDSNIEAPDTGSDSSGTGSSDNASGSNSNTGSVEPDYANYKKLTFYPESSVDDLYDTISWLIFNEKNNGHPLLVRNEEGFEEATGLGISSSPFLFNSEILDNRFYVQTKNSVYLIGVALRNNGTYQYYLSDRSREGELLPSVCYLYIY